MFERNRPSNTILADRNYARSLGRIVDQPPVLDLAHFVLGADGHMNFLCMGGCTVGPELAWDLVQTFLAADFSQAARHLRRLAKSLPRRPRTNKPTSNEDSMLDDKITQLRHKPAVLVLSRQPMPTLDRANHS